MISYATKLTNLLQQLDTYGTVTKPNADNKNKHTVHVLSRRDVL